MNNSGSNTSFDFCPPIDGHYLFDLYAGDYVMIWETFTDVLKDYEGFVERICHSWETSDAQALKSAIHKIKPLFGFVGLLCVQSQCQEFENACQQAEMTTLKDEYNLLKDKLVQAKSFIQAEACRLERFNAV